MRFFHVSPLRLSSAVTFGHPSSVKVDLTHNSSSGGTFSRVFKCDFCTKLIFRSFVFHSHMSNHLSYFPLVEHWPLAHTTPSLNCSIRIDLRSDLTWECRFILPTTSVLIHFVCRLFLLRGSWTQGWGVLFNVYLEAFSSWNATSGHTSPFLGPLA